MSNLEQIERQETPVKLHQQYTAPITPDGGADNYVQFDKVDQEEINNSNQDSEVNIEVKAKKSVDI